MKQTIFLGPAQYEELVRAITDVLEDADFNHDRAPPNDRQLAGKILYTVLTTTGIAPIWQPIETAPKDGSRVLCNAAGWDGPRWLLWQENVKPPDWGDWRDAEVPSFDIFHPTHWLPIPERTE